MTSNKTQRLWCEKASFIKPLTGCLVLRCLIKHSQTGDGCPEGFWPKVTLGSMMEPWPGSRRWNPNPTWKVLTPLSHADQAIPLLVKSSPLGYSGYYNPRKNNPNQIWNMTSLLEKDWESADPGEAQAWVQGAESEKHPSLPQSPPHSSCLWGLMCAQGTCALNQKTSKTRIRDAPQGL
jgi:hypothetical protein